MGWVGTLVMVAEVDCWSRVVVNPNEALLLRWGAKASVERQVGDDNKRATDATKEIFIFGTASLSTRALFSVEVGSQ